MDLLGPWHLIIVAGIFVMMFGAKRLPDAARSLGKSARILKTELKDMHDDPRQAPSVAVPDTARVPVMPHPVLDPDAVDHSL